MARLRRTETDSTNTAPSRFVLADWWDETDADKRPAHDGCLSGTDEERRFSWLAARSCRRWSDARRDVLDAARG